MRGTTLRTILVVMLMLGASLAQAGTVWVNVGGALVPCDHPIAIAAGLGCQPASVAAKPLTAPMQPGRCYVNADNSCTFCAVAIGRTYAQNALAVILERVAGVACPAPFYAYDPTVVPAGWSEVTLVWPAPSR